MGEWWRDAVIYQIYPRSFQDSTGDGIGDLPGITSRLDHVASLGVDAIWLSPFFTSPDKDMGYDVADYCDVNPLFGTLADFDAMLARAHELGLKVIIDQVYSHTSDQHAWFAESRANRDNPKSNWYVWADPKADGTPPSNWPSVFGGTAWRFDTRRMQYYLHNFLIEQPDLNFHEPAVVDAICDVARFWLDRGVDGFRLDTANYYVHDAQLRDNPAAEYHTFPVNPYEAQNHLYSKNQPENLEVLRRLRAVTDAYPDRMMVGEIGERGARAIEIMGTYTSGGDKLHLAYSFELLGPRYDPSHFRTTVEGFFDGAPGGWPCWSFSNHDVDRHVSRWTPAGGDGDAVARQAIALLCALPGAIGIYQGEELGQTQTDILFEELQDLGNIDFWPEHKGRDGCRTPMVWDADAPNAGFSTGSPWLPVKAPQAAKAVGGQERQNDSPLHRYRETLAFRRSQAALRGAEFEFLDVAEPCLALARGSSEGGLLCLFNLSDVAMSVELDKAEGLVGPHVASLEGACLELPAWGFAYVAQGQGPKVAS